MYRAYFQREQKHDLESFVRVLMALYYNFKAPESLNECSFRRLAAKSILYWEAVDEQISKSEDKEWSVFWKKALGITRGNFEKKICGEKKRMESLKEHLLTMRFHQINLKLINDLCMRKKCENQL